MLELYLEGIRDSSNHLKQWKHRIIFAVVKVHYKYIVFSTEEWTDRGKILVGRLF